MKSLREQDYLILTLHGLLSLDNTQSNALLAANSCSNTSAADFFCWIFKRYSSSYFELRALSSSSANSSAKLIFWSDVNGFLDAVSRNSSFNIWISFRFCPILVSSWSLSASNLSTRPFVSIAFCFDLTLLRLTA